jgi:DNA repair exonuclease SbcCD nuclease subunit
MLIYNYNLGENERSEMMKQISFIHAADLHLDSPMVGLSYLPKEIFDVLKESTFTALTTLVQAAIQHQVDFVILAGDLFDEQDRSVRAQIKLRKEMERLKSYGIQVYVVHGNHDHLNGDWVHLAMPDNVHIFSRKIIFQNTEKWMALTFILGFSMAIMKATVNMDDMHPLQRKTYWKKTLIIGH